MEQWHLSFLVHCWHIHNCSPRWRTPRVMWAEGVLRGKHQVLSKSGLFGRNHGNDSTGRAKSYSHRGLGCILKIRAIRPLDLWMEVRSDFHIKQWIWLLRGAGGGMDWGRGALKAGRKSDVRPKRLLIRLGALVMGSLSGKEKARPLCSGGRVS